MISNATTQVPGEHRFSASRPRGYLWRRKARRFLACCAACLKSPPADRGDRLGILTYHRVVPGSPQGRPTWSVTPARFEQQLRGLRERGFHPIALEVALHRFGRGEPVPTRAFVVTFDDGFENNFLYAWPILQRQRIPATIFLATRYIGASEPFPFEDWRPARLGCAPASTWRALSREQCHRLREGALIQFGSHTDRHANYLGRPAALAEDLAQSWDFLREQFGLAAPPFSFPFGAVDPELVAVLRAAGASCGLTTRERGVRAGEDPLGWGRFSVEPSDTPATLAAKLDGRYAALCGAAGRLLGRRRAADDRPFAPPGVRRPVAAARRRAASGGGPWQAESFALGGPGGDSP